MTCPKADVTFPVRRRDSLAGWMPIRARPWSTSVGGHPTSGPCPDRRSWFTTDPMGVPRRHPPESRGNDGRRRQSDRHRAVRSGSHDRAPSEGFVRCHHTADRVLAEVLSERVRVSLRRLICCRGGGCAHRGDTKVPESERRPWLEREVTHRLTGADRDGQSMATGGVGMSRQGLSRLMR